MEKTKTNATVNFVNCTPHPVEDKDGNKIMPSGIRPSLGDQFTEFDENGICERKFHLSGVPEPQEGPIYIVSAIALEAIKTQLGRTDFVAPATGHPLCKRDENGRIISTPGFVR